MGQTRISGHLVEVTKEELVTPLGTDTIYLIGGRDAAGLHEIFRTAKLPHSSLVQGMFSVSLSAIRHEQETHDVRYLVMVEEKLKNATVETQVAS